MCALVVRNVAYTDPPQRHGCPRSCRFARCAVRGAVLKLMTTYTNTRGKMKKELSRMTSKKLCEADRNTGYGET